LEPTAVLAQSGFTLKNNYFGQLGSPSQLNSCTKSISVCELLDSMQFGTDGADNDKNDGEQTAGSGRKSTPDPDNLSDRKVIRAGALNVMQWKTSMVMAGAKQTVCTGFTQRSGDICGRRSFAELDIANW
jgi:hypothetical protein